ncbi:hypothetical protein BSNK01_13410 [Bacillaceae bacterium]
MTVSRNMFFAIFFSTLLALLLSFLPNADWLKHGSSELPVFENGRRPVQLDEENLVDMLLQNPTYYPIRRVKWENRNLFIDLALTPDKAKNEWEVYRDLANLVGLAFAETDNVERIFTRLLRANEEEEVLVALSAERSDWEEAAPVFRNEAPDYKRALESFYEVQYGVSWKTVFP